MRGSRQDVSGYAYDIMAAPFRKGWDVGQGLDFQTFPLRGAWDAERRSGEPLPKPFFEDTSAFLPTCSFASPSTRGDRSSDER